MRIIYVSKFPPSPSGIGLYSRTSLDVLRGVADVNVIPGPAEPRRSQQLRQALRGLVIGWRLRHGADVVPAGVSGGGPFAFYLPLGLVVGRSAAPLFLTCHDVPSIVGQPLLFACLDRRGLRRLGVVLSQRVGAGLQRRVLQG